MRVISNKTLIKFYTKHSDAAGPLKAWYSEAKHGIWKTPSDIKAKFNSADFIQGNRVVFNIGGNKYRLIVKIAYIPGLVYIRFVGTHAEYNKIDAGTI